MAKGFELDLDKYNRLPGVLPRMVVPGVLFAVGCVALGEHFSIFAPDTGAAPEQRLERIVYFVYLAFFISMWGMYFMSRWGRSFFRIRTLRRLLLATTEDWSVLVEGYVKHQDAIDKEKLEDFEKKFKDKSNASMMNLGMLIAAAALELSQMAEVSHWHGGDTNTHWSRVTLGLGVIAAICSLICFIIAADSLDSLFNQFRVPTERHLLLRYFYVQSINPRYFGLMTLLVAATLIVADISPCLGALSVAIIASVGFPHWFPSNVAFDSVVPSRPGVRILILAGLLLVPMLPHVLAVNNPAMLAALGGN